EHNSCLKILRKIGSMRGLIRKSKKKDSTSHDARTRERSPVYQGKDCCSGIVVWRACRRKGFDWFCAAKHVVWDDRRSHDHLCHLLRDLALYAPAKVPPADKPVAHAVVPQKVLLHQR